MLGDTQLGMRKGEGKDRVALEGGSPLNLKFEYYK